MDDKATETVNRMMDYAPGVMEQIVLDHLVLNAAGIANDFADRHLFDAIAVSPGVEPRVQAAVKVCRERAIPRFFCLGNNKEEQDRGETYDAPKIRGLFAEAEDEWEPEIDVRKDGPNAWEQAKNLIGLCRENHAQRIAFVAGAWHAARAWLTCIKYLRTEWGYVDSGDTPLVLPLLVNVGVCGELVRGASALHIEDGYKPGAFTDIVRAEVERRIRYEQNVATVEDVLAYFSQPHFEPYFEAPNHT